MQSLPEGIDFQTKVAIIGKTVNKSSAFLSYLDLFYYVMIGSLVIMFVPLLYKKYKE